MLHVHDPRNVTLQHIAVLAGEMHDLATGEPYCLYVRDNQSVVFSDFYHEQSGGMFYIEGSDGSPPGRITWTGGRTHMWPPGDERRADRGRGLMTLRDPEVGMRIDNYRGEVFMGAQDFSDGLFDRILRQAGSNPVTVFFFGNTFYGVTLDAEGDAGLTVKMLGNEAVGKMEYVPRDNVSEEEKAALARAFDDLRRLGQVDRELNYIRPMEFVAD